jgi:glycosyltransferase involved in cell wall biosynthesis
MTTIAWVLHNNASDMARLIVNGLRQLGRTEFEHLCTREDILGVRPPDIPPGIERDKIGTFPDRRGFEPSLASPDFWNRLRRADWIVFTVNGGANHNAYEAANIIRRYNLFDRLVYLDEDEGGELHRDFRDMFLKARLAFTMLRPHFYERYRMHPHVVQLDFSAVEQRYVRATDAEKRTTVFYRGRAGKRMPHREPFIAALHERAFPGAAIMPPLQDNVAPEDIVFQFQTGNRHNVSYYEHLADAEIAVYLNGMNPIGYQFWENAALKAAQVMQSPRRTRWYAGGQVQRDAFDVECYRRPFVNGRDFLSFESPEEMLDQVQYLMDHPPEREAMAESCYRIAMEHHTEKARAERFLAYLERTP